MSDRLPCLVPFCRRTRRLRDGQTVEASHPWICGIHWRQVPPRLKRRRRRIWRIWDKANRANAGRLEYRARVLYWRLWDKIKASAIEISAGITAPRRPRRSGPSRAHRPRQ